MAPISLRSWGKPRNGFHLSGGKLSEGEKREGFHDSSVVNTTVLALSQNQCMYNGFLSRVWPTVISFGKRDFQLVTGGVGSNPAAQTIT